jgi:cyclophilin family peptidyl-prolyl cis-trans isomerase
VVPRANSPRRIRRGTIALLTLVAGACAHQRGAPAESSATTSILTDADVLLVARLLEAADTRRRDTLLVDEALSSKVSYVRSVGARLIGQNTMAARSTAARVLVTDPDTAVAADAAFSLGLLRDSSATATLVAALAAAPGVSDAAAWSLGELGAAGRRALERVLSSGQPPAALPAVLQAAAKLRPVPAALVTPYLRRADKDVQRSAAYAVTRSRVPAATRALLALADEPTTTDTADRRVVDLWSYVARGLSLQVAGDSLGTPARAALTRLASYPHPHVRISALRALATYGPDTRSFFMARPADPDANTRIAISQALGDVLGTSADDWRWAWNADSSFTSRRAVVAGALRDGVRLPALEAGGASSWVSHTDWRFRAAAAQAAGSGSIADVDAIALPLLRDADPRVRAAAWGTAAALADSAAASGKPCARAAVGASLGDPDLFVRAALLDALRSRARAVDASLALQAWYRAKSDPENDARVAALRVVATAWRNDSAGFSSALRDSLMAARAPADPIELGAGRLAGPLAHWPNSSTTSRGTAWYVSQVRAFVVPALSGRPTRVAVNTARGTVQVRLFGADAPLTIANFVTLARRGYYNRLVFHRVVPNFVAQDGDPRGDGSGGPGYAIRDELNRRWYDRGAVGMALSGPDTGGSQYFIAHSPQPHLDGHYTVFGHVIAGYDALDAIVQGDALLSVIVQ